MAVEIAVAVVDQVRGSLKSATTCSIPAWSGGPERLKSMVRAGNGTEVARASPRPLDAPVMITSEFKTTRLGEYCHLPVRFELLDQNLSGHYLRIGMLSRMKIATAFVFVLFLSSCGASTDGNSGDTPPTGQTASTEVPVTTLPDLGPPAELVEVDGWLQSDVTSLEELEGKVVVVWFWTFGCYNCKNTLPNLKELYEKHQGEEFEIVGIHAPEFDYEADVDNIVEAAGELGVTWPIVLDTNKRTFHRWQGPRAYWPRTYVLDRDGTVRYDHIGEGRYEELNEAVATLLG
jgi:thiol-disulfide isomerase/thioredoxin